MQLLPSKITRYILLFVTLLAIMALIDDLAKSVDGYGELGFAVTLWGCFAAAYSWLLLEPMVRAALLMRKDGDAGSLRRVERIGASVASTGGIALPRLYVYDGGKFDVMVTGIGKGATILLSTTAARLDDEHLRAVLAHEFGHIRLGHSGTRLTLYGSLLALAIIGNNTPFVAVLANFFVLWTLRQMEFAADSDAAKMVGTANVRSSLDHVGRVLGDIPTWQSAFSPHPSFKERIERL